jgi:hypothetical protein
MSSGSLFSSLLSATSTSITESVPHGKVLFVCILVVAIFETILYRYKLGVQKEYSKRKTDILSSEEAEKASLQYFSKLHIVGVVRACYFFAISMTLISAYNIRAFSFFALAFGAIIIALRDVIISLLAYPHVVLGYDIGDDIYVNGVLGEIVRIKPLSTQLAGKNKKGDFNGRLHNIPNSRFLLDMVERQEIKNLSYRKSELEVLFVPEQYKHTFTAWLEELKEKLDSMLRKRSLKEVGNFKSHAGMRYKLDYDYNEDGFLIVTISFITSVKNAALKKEEIVSYVESTKIKQEGFSFKK